MLFIAGWMAKGKFHTCPIPEIRIDTVTVYEVVIDPQIVPQFIEVVKKDTILLNDTIFIQENINYIAQMDSVYKDSLLTLKVQYISPSPLDKRSFFSIDAKVKEKIVTRTIRDFRTVTFNPDFFFELGARVDTTISYVLSAGVYPISYKHVKSFIKAGALYNNGWHVQAELGTRIEF